MAKTHAPAGPAWESGLTPTLCGQLETSQQLHPTEPSCKKCQRHLGRTAAPQPVPEPVHVPQSLCLEDGFPFVNVENWTRVKCGTHYGYASQGGEPPPRARLFTAHRWPSVTTALRWYARNRRDGYTEAAGGVSAIVEELGARVQSSGASESSAIREVGERKLIESALLEAYRGHELGVDRCVGLLFTRVLAEQTADEAGAAVGLNRWQVGSLVYYGKLGVYERLFPLGMVGRL